MPKMPWKALEFIVVGLLCGTGCVQRTLTVRTDPPGALVYLNDQEIGRTPVTRNFLWYGIYDLEIRLDGYEALKTTAPVIAPWWQIVPIDFFAEFFRVTDHHDLYYTLRVPNQREEEPDLIVKRAEQLRGELESTRRPASQPANRPKHHETTRPAKPNTRPTTRPTTRQ